MDGGIFLRAAGTQIVVLAAAFFLLWAAPLPDGFFSDYGVVAGPVSWLVCSALTARRLGVPARRALMATVAGGAAAGVAGQGVDHTLGLGRRGALCGRVRPRVPEAARPPGADGELGLGVHPGERGAALARSLVSPLDADAGRCALAR